MRTARLKVEYGTGYYHCVSRVVNRDFVLRDAEKEQFVKWMRRYEEFCGVRVVTFCVMSNHFHVLVEVPERPAEDLLPSDEELLRRLELVSSGAMVADYRRLLAEYRAEGNAAGARELRERAFGRMWDVSAFMQQLKGRFTQWFNKKHKRCGTLWEERFKSVLVEGSGTALATMAAYIDLNPVRAGLDADPKDYRWSGYGESVAGKAEAVDGLYVVGEYLGVEGKQRRGSLLKVYRRWLYEEGREIKGDWAQGIKGRRGVKAEKVEEVIAKGGELSRGEVLRVRVRYFCDGAILGSREFVEELLERRRAATGLVRRTGAAKMKGKCWEGLHTLRALRQGVYG